jgi:hypothetical protein
MPTPPDPPPPAQSHAAVSNWKGSSTVVSSDEGNACEGATVVGATSTDIEWRITTDAPTILLEADIVNWPANHMRYTGTLTGNQFAGSYATEAEYSDSFCEVRGGRLSGSFSADMLSFDATETLIWGPPDEERTVQRRWTASKL